MAGKGSVTLILGGARSGKSRRAETLALETGLSPVYIATATGRDAEMLARIEEHRERRGPDWQTIEERFDLATVLAETSTVDTVILIDCLSFWLSNLMLAGSELYEAETALLEGLKATPGPVVLVSSEVGMGIVPENALARAFRDAQGRMNQSVAEIATRVEFCAAGLPLVLKPQAAS